MEKIDREREAMNDKDVEAGSYEKSVRFSDGDISEIHHIETDSSARILGAHQQDMSGEDEEAGASFGSFPELSRTSVRAEELEDEGNDVVLTRKKTFANLMARAWEIKPEDVMIEELLGNGAYGQVYKGRWSGTDVAVKIVQEDLVYQQSYISTQDISDAMKVFWAEVKLMRTLSHPNVVQFLGACTRRHPRMLLMEYLPNGTLEDVFEEAQMRNRPLSFEVATKYAIDAAKGIAYLHHNPHRTVIHRDIKPGNLLLDKTGAVKVADFGLSKAVDESVLATLNSKRDLMAGKDDKSDNKRKKQMIRKKKPFEQRGYQVGTYIYMPAELFRSKSDYTSKVDVYSYAMILYELYEGRQPFEEYGANPMYAAAAAAAGIRPEMHRTPKRIREIIEKCWAEDPRERPTFLEILHDLELVEAMIRYDRSAKSKIIVTVNYLIHLFWFVLTCAAVACEYFYLVKTRDEGLKLWVQGRDAGVITPHMESAYDDPVLLTFIFVIPSIMIVASLMFVIVPNKRIRAIRRRGPKFSRRKGMCWSGLRRCCGGALEILRRITLVSGVLSICTVILQYEYEEYILDDICNGDSSPFDPLPGIDKALCEQNYKHSHKAIVFQWILLTLNISQLIIHQCGLPEPKIDISKHKNFKIDERTSLLSPNSMTARQFYQIKHNESHDDFQLLNSNEYSQFR